jgi:hypothetical protein
MESLVTKSDISDVGLRGKSLVLMEKKTYSPVMAHYMFSIAGFGDYKLDR